MTNVKEAYPLQWPVGHTRSHDWRIRSLFKQTPDKAQRFLRDEIQRLVGDEDYEVSPRCYRKRPVDPELVVSTNLRIRADGGVYSQDMDKTIQDPGVAIYFKYKGKEVSLCCDKYRTVWENIYALACSIEATRKIERYGVSDFIERAFAGFAALPPARGDQWWIVLGFMTPPINFDIARKYYLDLSKVHHPDRNGDPAIFVSIGRAYEEAKKHFNIN